MDELYIIARSVLLDALEAIGPHRDAVVLVGAQAVYLRVGDADIAVQPYTTDGDLAIDPAILADTPPLELALKSAGFRPKTIDSIGIWVTQRRTANKTDAAVPIDLLVPSGASPQSGRRAARLAGHEARTARKTVGIEGALVDADVMRLEALDPSDKRYFDIRVAGAAALLVAKVHKIQDRTGTDRQSDKDALDVLRLLRGTALAELSLRFQNLLDNSRSSAVALAALDLLATQFGTRRSVGVQMAIQAAGVLMDGDELGASLVALVEDFLGEMRG